MAAQLEPVFARLRQILAEHSGGLTVQADTAERYGLAATPGPATLRAWRGEVRQEKLPVAWVEIGQKYVSYHLMGVADPKALLGCSDKLRARKQGRTCFNFQTVDETLFRELTGVTSRSLAGLRRAGYISDE
jgi:hypothetical protein